MPTLEFDENNHATITTHKGNDYVVRKLSDGEFLSAMSSGGDKRADLSMIALVSASLVTPALNQQQVRTELFDGELMLLFNVITNYYQDEIDFLNSMVQRN